jgi:hypothetical protein
VKIVAATWYKYDRDYLGDWRRNLSDLCDDFLTIEDTDGGLMYDEGRYREDLLAQAKEMGADWVAVIDPDERLEKSAARKIKEIINGHDGEKAMLQLHFRELYTPNKYRIDGEWGKKIRVPIFPLLEDNIYSDQRIHTPKHPLNGDYKVIDTGLNIYHLKHIVPELRKHRRDLYSKLDPTHEYQSIGYDYLNDETGMELRRIAFRRMYRPRYREYKMDNGIFEI